MGESARDSLCRHGSKRNSPNRYVLPMGAGPLTGDMCEPTASRFSSVAFRNILQPAAKRFSGPSGLSVLFHCFFRVPEGLPHRLLPKMHTHARARFAD